MLLTDALGSLVATTDAAGGVQSELTYEPFGNTEMSAPAPAYRFTGREHDEPLYLYYYRARYYHTDLQRFISEDPIQFAGGVNFFVYVANAPTGFVDPRGLDKQDSVIPVAAAAPSLPPCTDITIQGNVGSISVQQPWSGRVQWGVTMDIPITGFLIVGESFRKAGASRREFNPSKPYPYPGTAGTTHGSRGDLQVGSQYTLTAVAIYPPGLAGGTLTCIVQ